jgi:hypothetical protein
MKEEKKRLLEDVMDKETYKVAKEILEKFAPEQLRKPPVSWSLSNLWFNTCPLGGRDAPNCDDDKYLV